ncbi:Sensory box histidine kinase/response regulator [hydrothermal vent metagenome]|uniref:Sensory box histidine kinase/response regulator n=1 Tax=hydrothermal vent metagenome TaxID=652676 RepID=A0A1W1C2I8_9ZZZZ
MDDEKFKRILGRERSAKKEAERLLEVKSLELWELNQNLEAIINERTFELQTSLEKVQKLAETKSEFLSNMSHEIRTPLNAIIGFIDFMHATEYEKKSFDKYFGIIKSSSKNLLQITNDILDISKLQSGKFSISIIKVNLKEEVECLIALFKSKAKEENVYLDVNFSHDFPPYLLVDDTRILQIISNFVSNALKFTLKDGKVSVDLHYSKETKVLNLEVIDTGIGIEESAQESIFKAFEQEDSSTTRNFGGTGLGLSISLSLIRLMKGKVIFKSVKNEGSIFGFSIPAEFSEIDDEATEVALVDYKHKGKILLVEDNKTNIILMEMIFDELSLEYDIVFNGQEAVDAVKENTYELVLMDNQMPVLSGKEATIKIREFNTDLPIVALSANVMQEEQEEFIKAGMNATLAKPISQKKLVEVLNKYL